MTPSSKLDVSQPGSFDSISVESGILEESIPALSDNIIKSQEKYMKKKFSCAQ